MQTIYAVILATVVSAVVALLMTPLVQTLAHKWEVVAHPGGRRVHSRPTPMLGGVAMFAGFVAAMVAVLLWRPEMLNDKQALNQVRGLLLGGTLVAVVGVLDDRFELPGWAQALTIVAGGIVLVLFGVEIRHITNPFHGGERLVWLGWLGAPLTVLWILMVTKALDCMDGLDGLAAGIAVIASGSLMLMAMGSGPRFGISAVLAAALMGAALGFLRFNYPPAKIFMGTVGAQFLGFALAGVSIGGAFKIATFVAVAAPILILGVPLFDTAFVVVRRILSGRKIHEADTSHLHHRLLDRGLSHRQTIWVIYAITLAFCAAAYALFRYVK